MPFPLEPMRKKWLPRVLPLWTASRILADGSWATKDGKVRVRVADVCPKPMQDPSCISIYGNEQDDVSRRARFLAWPLTYGTRLKRGDAATRSATVDAIKARVLKSDSRIALVVDGGWEAREDRVPLAVDAKRVERPACRSASAACEFLRIASIVHPKRRLGFSLGRSEIPVVPRLGSLVHCNAFKEELRKLLP